MGRYWWQQGSHKKIHLKQKAENQTKEEFIYESYERVLVKKKLNLIKNLNYMFNNYYYYYYYKKKTLKHTIHLYGTYVH